MAVEGGDRCSVYDYAAFTAFIGIVCGHGVGRETRNVETAIQRSGIHYPVAQDNRYATWNAYENKYWPAAYLVDRKGSIVLKHFGEGSYDEMESAIRKLLTE